MNESKLSQEFKTIAEEEFNKVKGKIAYKSYSDVIDQEGHQYVNLIQEGGGVWGIALIGYTYILEMAGIRFLKTAGTSAGAINTVFLAAIPNPKNGKFKSEIIAELLAELNFFSLVDGHWFARKLIKNLITNNGYAKQVAFSFRTFLILVSGLLYFGNILQWSDINVNRFALLALILMAIVPLVAYLRAKSDFNKANLGLLPENPCDLRQSNAVDIKPDTTFKYFTVIGITLLLGGLFSMGYIFNNQAPTCILYLDLGALLVMIVVALLLNDQFDRDFLTLGTLLFVFLTIFSFGLGRLKIPDVYRFHKELMIGGALLCLIPALIGRWISYFLTYLLLLFGLAIFFVGLAGSLPETLYSRFSYISLAATLLFTFLIVIVGGFLLYLFRKFSNSEFGINPGNYFQCWVREKLKTFNEGKDYLVEDLERIWQDNASEIELRQSREPKMMSGSCESTTDDLKQYKRDSPPVVIISSDITSQNKAEFPKMKDLYWNKNESVHVADFVRASMAIPFFFEPYKRENVPQEEFKLWNTFFEYNFRDNPFNTAYFVDGGLLSNFPFNVFHNPAVKNARMPTFGVRLDSLDGKNHADFKGLFDYIGKMFNSGRGYYDQDFLLKNPYYRNCIKIVDLKKHNWLNFFVTDKEKKEMFRIGAEAACEFLKSFDWKKFQEERDAGVHKLCNCE